VCLVIYKNNIIYNMSIIYIYDIRAYIILYSISINNSVIYYKITLYIYIYIYIYIIYIIILWYTCIYYSVIVL
jgi:hypothetical protein